MSTFHFLNFYLLAKRAGVAQLVERKPSKLDVAGSSPVSRLAAFGRFAREERGESGEESQGAKSRLTLLSTFQSLLSARSARVAQLVEHTLGKGEVTGSIPVASLASTIN